MGIENFVPVTRNGQRLNPDYALTLLIFASLIHICGNQNNEPPLKHSQYHPYSQYCENQVCYILGQWGIKVVDGIKIPNPFILR